MNTDKHRWRKTDLRSTKRA